MIVFPKSIEDAAGRKGVIRAGATDLHELRRLSIVEGDLVDLRDVPGIDRVRRDAKGGLRLGAKMRIAALAADPDVRAEYPGLAQAAGGLATPQIRAVATLGGNLLQHTRCWYFRNPDVQCLKKGGSRCLAREGDHLYHSCFDLGPCAAVHASTLGMALLAYEARAEIVGAPSTTVAELYGDGKDPTREHDLPPGAVLTEVVLGPPAKAERAAYFRAISRARAEWPLVEALARLVVDGGTIRLARVAIGGVANRPLRLPKVEAVLEGARADETLLAKAAKAATEGAAPLPMTGYKVELVEATVLETLERALSSTAEKTEKENE